MDRTLDDRSEVRTGIVGLGNIGHYHAQRLVDLDVPLVAGLDVADSARQRFADRYRVDTFEDPEVLYESVDAVIVTTPNKYHEHYSVEALERGIHVLIEKPLAHTLASAERIAATAAGVDATCMVGFNNRYANPVRVIADRIDRGWIGDVVHVEANYVRRRGVPGRGSWFTRREIAGGGALIDLGVHAIDLVMYLLSFPDIEEVTGTTRSAFGDRDDYAYLNMWGRDEGPIAFDVDDSASAFVRLSGETTFSLEVAWATNRPSNHEFIFRGTDAAAILDLLEGDLTFYRAGRAGADHLENLHVETRQEDTHAAEQRAFFDRIVDGDYSTTDVSRALSVQRIVDAIYRSSDQQAAVRC